MTIVDGVIETATPRVRLVAERFETRLARAFTRMIRVVQDGIEVNVLGAHLENNRMEALAYLDLTNRMIAASEGKGIPAREESFKEVLRVVFEAGANAALEDLDTVPVAKASTTLPTVGLTVAFDLLNPRAITFLNTYTFNLIREISSSTTEGIRQVLLTAFAQGGHPYEQARAIRNMIGLTSSQARAVGNFYTMLSGADSELKRALTRKLRDRRFDGTIRRAIEDSAFLDAKRVQEMTRRYYERYLKFRAETIARTETLRASNSGQQEAWAQAADQGLLDRKITRRHWLVAGDERTCEHCLSVANMNADGVPLNKDFQTPAGPVMQPPLHPRCRCTTVLKFKRKPI